MGLGAAGALHAAAVSGYVQRHPKLDCARPRLAVRGPPLPPGAGLRRWACVPSSLRRLEGRGSEGPEPGPDGWAVISVCVGD